MFVCIVTESMMSKDNPSAVDDCASVTLERFKKIEEGSKKFSETVDKMYNQDNWDNPIFRERYMNAEHYWNTRDENKVKEQTIESQRLSKETF